MANYKLEKNAEYDDIKSKIPNQYPASLKECMQILASIKYKSYGFGMVFLSYSHSSDSWSVIFRNAANFQQPDIQEQSPIEAVHEMFDFLSSLNAEDDINDCCKENANIVDGHHPDEKPYCRKCNTTLPENSSTQNNS